MAPFSTCWYPSVTAAAATDSSSMDTASNGGRICRCQSDVTVKLVDTRSHSIHNNSSHDNDNKIVENLIENNNVEINNIEDKNIDANTKNTESAKGGSAKEEEAKDFHKAIHRIKVEMIMSLYSKPPQQS